MKGTVKFFDETKEFGFITPEEGEDVYVSKDALAPGVVIRENDKVSFDVEQGDKGPRAANVTLDEGEEAPAEEPAAEEAPAEEPATEEEKPAE